MVEVMMQKMTKYGSGPSIESRTRVPQNASRRCNV